MAYTNKNYKTKKQMKEDFKNGIQIPVYQPGFFGPDIQDGLCAIEGPHYPAPHTWYASVEVKDGVIIKIKG